MNYVSRLRALREDKDLKQKEIGKILNKTNRDMHIWKTVFQDLLWKI